MGSFNIAHFQIIFFFSIFAFVALILFNKNPARKKSLYFGLVVSFVLAFLSSNSRSFVNDEQAMKIICETAKGDAIGACVSMQAGAAGMGRCQIAVEKAGALCKRPELTIMNILEEASKKASK
jgi:hypothetical protein